jgi:oxalate decarboxylase
VTPRPGELRELHWHPNATSKAGRRSGCSLPGAKAQTTNFNPGDIGYVKRNNGHYVKNIGNTDLYSGAPTSRTSPCPNG